MGRLSAKAGGKGWFSMLGFASSPNKLRVFLIENKLLKPNLAKKPVGGVIFTLAKAVFCASWLVRLLVATKVIWLVVQSVTFCFFAKFNAACVVTLQQQSLETISGIGGAAF